MKNNQEPKIHKTCAECDAEECPEHIWGSWSELEYWLDKQYRQIQYCQKCGLGRVREVTI